MDKFVRNELTQKELKDLNIQTLLDPNVERELKLRNDIAKGIEIVGNEDLKLVLEKIHYQNIRTEDKTKKNRFVGGIIAFVLFCSAMIFIVNQKFFSSKNKINNYAEYYEPYIPSISTRGEGNQVRIKDFGLAYGQKRYKRALLIIEPVLENSNNELVLIAAICAMEIRDFEKSNILFDQIINSNDYFFIDHAKWYKALGLLKQDQLDKAKILLNDLAGDVNADHHSQAKALLKDI